MSVRRVSDVFGMKGTLPFIDVDVDRDNRLFIDPSAIRNSRSGYAKRGHRQLVDFFSEILTCARSPKGSSAHRKGRTLLQEMHEPNETRLGYSEGEPEGKAFGDKLGGLLWDQIVLNRTLHTSAGSSMTLQTAVLSRLERVPLFVDRVDRDLVSDLSTRVTFDVLADFTSDVMSTSPAMAASATNFDRPVWDRRTASLVTKKLLLPTVRQKGSGAVKPLLLVPKDWVYWRLVMAPESFYARYATETLQQEQTTYTSEGKPNRPTKKSIREAHRDKKATNALQANKYALEHDRDLAGEFQQSVDATFAPLTDSEIERHLS